MIGRILLAALLWLLGASAAEAVPSCTPTSTGIAFGTFSGAQITISGYITLTCTGTGKENYDIRLSTGSSGSFTNRTVKNGANSLTYNLSDSPTFSKVWGSGSGGTSLVSGTADMAGATTKTITVPLYGRLFAQAKPAPGSYVDTITVTLTVKDAVTTTTFPVTVNVLPDCTISAADLSFGTYTGVQLDGQSSISVTCTSGTSWNVGLDQGSSAGATVTTRAMTTAGGTHLSYSLYRNVARTQNWGNSIGSDTVGGTGSGSAQSISVYGRIPAGQTPVAGAYSDTIVATITF